MDYFNKMEGASGYVRASLLGLSQGMSALHDPLRLHPALHPQISSDAGKEGTSLLRPLTDYAHLPLLPFSAPHFLPPHLDPRLPFTTSAFHPLHAHHPKLPPHSTSAANGIVSASVSSLPGSAFSPLPAKCSKVDIDIPTSTILFSHSGLLASLDPRSVFLGGPSPPGVTSTSGGDDRGDSPSPRGSHGSRESPCHMRENESPNSTADDVRARKVRPGEFWCPVCGLSLRPGEAESHFTHEVEKLTRIPHSRPSSQRASTPTSVSSPLSPHLSHLSRPRDPGWETYQRVRANRQVRLRTKKRRSGRSDESSSAACPVCSERVAVITPEDFHSHVDHCLRRGTEDEVVDVEGDDSFEECGWGTPRRIRTSSLVRSRTPIPMRDEPEAPSEKETPAESNDGATGGSGTEAPGGENGPVNEILEREVEELKEKVRTLERDGQPASKFQCLVCQAEYDRPTVSTVCWHVLCEACWTHSLDSKSECPQCAQSLTAQDLRHIHL